MRRETIIRAWKDPEFRSSLSDEERTQLPENPAGAIELTDEELELVVGGRNSASYVGSARGSSYSRAPHIRWPETPSRDTQPEQEQPPSNWRRPRRRESVKSSYRSLSWRAR